MTADNKKKTGAVLVQGGGIAGIQAALDLANSGFKVYMVERSAAIGGMMSHLKNELVVECLPKDLPEFLTVDVSGLNLNDSLHLSDIKLPAGVLSVEAEAGKNPVVVAVHALRAEEAEVPVAAVAEAAAAPAAAADKKGDAKKEEPKKDAKK